MEIQHSEMAGALAGRLFAETLVQLADGVTPATVVAARRSEPSFDFALFDETDRALAWCADPDHPDGIMVCLDDKQREVFVVLPRPGVEPASDAVFALRYQVREGAIETTEVLIVTDAKDPSVFEEFEQGLHAGLKSHARSFELSGYGRLGAYGSGRGAPS